jgi:Immunity protein 49
MNSATAIEKRKQVREIHLKELPMLVEKIRFRRKPISLNGCLGNLSTSYRNFAVASYFCENDLKTFKQHLHLSVVSSAAGWEISSYQALWTPKTIWDALLSDSPKAIQFTATLITEDLQNPEPNSGVIYSRMWQAALTRDDDVIRELLPKIEKKGFQKDRKDVREGRDFFTLLLAGDKEALEARILYDVKAPSDDPWFDDFISLKATAEAKLCHLRGIPVEIDHPRVPMDLVRIAPLPHYDDVYDFLAPGYEPPPEGLFGHLKAWVKKI